MLGRDQARQLAYNAGFRGQALDTIVAIAGYESGGWNTQAVNANRNRFGQIVSYDEGILQINTVAWPAFFRSYSPWDPQAEFDYAYSVISRRGTDFSPWVSYQTGAYQGYMQNTGSGNGGGGGGGIIDNLPGAVGGALGQGAQTVIPGAGVVKGAVQAGAENAGKALDIAGAVQNLPAGLESGAANLIKWAAPHAVLIGGALLAFMLFFKSLAQREMQSLPPITVA